MLTPDKLALSIASGDTKSITKAQGVGAKIANRIILELKNKFSAELTAEQSEIVGAVQMTEGAENLSEAAVALGKLDSSLSVEELIRQALKSLI